MYHPRSDIKGQVLADFIVELLNVLRSSLLDHLWILEIDGSFKAIGGKADMVL